MASKDPHTPSPTTIPPTTNKHKEILRFILHKRNPIFFKPTKEGFVTLTASTSATKRKTAFHINDSSKEFTLEDAVDETGGVKKSLEQAIGSAIDHQDHDENQDPSYYKDEYPPTIGLLKISTQEQSLHYKYGRQHHHSSEAVSFGQATIYYHNIILGDSPGVSHGIPIALGNECQCQETVDLVDQPLHPARWGGDDPLRIPPAERRNMLDAAGVPPDEIKRFSQFQALQKQNPNLAARMYPDLC